LPCYELRILPWQNFKHARQALWARLRLAKILASLVKQCWRTQLDSWSSVPYSSNAFQPQQQENQARRGKRRQLYSVWRDAWRNSISEAMNLRFQNFRIVK